jgi:multicomponent Na+:H+ antiporter subunit B
MKSDLLLRIATKLIVPFALVFGLYVQFHGDYGPGGGFQAGVICAGGIILYAIIFGLNAAQRIVPTWIVHRMIPLGVLLFAGVGVVGMLLGGQFLNYSVLARDPTAGQHMGILLVEFGVLVTVFGTMISVFYAFTGRGR